MGTQKRSKMMLAFAISILNLSFFFFFFSSSCHAQQEAETSAEMEALLQLKQSLKIEDNAWPLHSQPCFAWTGIQCHNGHVVSLHFPSINVPQQLVAMEALQKLQFLRNLNASGLVLSSSIPDWFGMFHQLESLDLSSTSLQGGIPSSFCSLSRLRTLSLAHNNLSGPVSPIFDNLLNLTFLDLSYNYFSGSFPYSLLNATLLYSVDLSWNHFTGSLPFGINKLTNLHHLSLAGNSFEGFLPMQLFQLSSLEHLDLASNQFRGSLSQLSALSHIVVLNLAHNRFSGTIPASISQCTQLQILILSHNLLNGDIPPTLGALNKLIYVSLSFNTFTGTIPVTLLNLTRIKNVDLSHNLLYGQLPLTQMQHAGPIVVDISFNFLNGSVPRGLVPVTGLRKNCFVGAKKQHTLRACRLFYKRKGLFLNGLLPQSILPNNVPPVIRESNLYRTKRLAVILAGVCGGVLAIVFVGTLALCFNRCDRQLVTDGLDKEEVDAGGISSADTGVFSINFSSLGEGFVLDQLLLATNSFSPLNLIASGHSGDLYKGTLDTGAAVVVKRIQCSKICRELYVNELEFFCRASHTRLVPLLGHCLEGPDEKFMVYKYMPNGDLASALQRLPSSGYGEGILPTLDWITRMKIAIGVAEGLAHLHHECIPPIVHRNVKARSILLDDKFEVRLGSLSDACLQDGEQCPGLIARFLGLSQSLDQVESGSCIASSGMDVYCFGKVLLELVSGKVEMSNQSDSSTDLWFESALSAVNIQDKELLSKIVDPFLIIDEDLLNEIWAVTIIAKACLNPKPSKRPSMRHVLKALENPQKVIRDETLNSALVSRTSSYSSWNEALFCGSRTTNFSQRLAISGPNV